MKYMFKAILRFNLQTHLKNIWLSCAVLGSTIFVILFAPNVLISERSGLPFVIDFYHANMIFPLLILSYTVWFIHKTSRGNVTELLDSYPYRNRQLFYGVVFSLYITFWLYAILQFVVILGIKAWFSGFTVPGMHSIAFFLSFSLINVILFVSMGTFVGIVCKESLWAYFLVFAYQVLNLMFDKFTPKHLHWFALLHSNVFKYEKFSSFGMFGNDALVFIANRLGALAISIFLFSVARLFFKSYREKTGIRFLRIAAAGALLVLVFSFGFYRHASTIPVRATEALAEQAVFVNLNLDIDDYCITGELVDGHLYLSVSFLVANTTDEEVPLAFYLVRNFVIDSLTLQGKPVDFEQQGDLVVTGETIAPGISISCLISYGGTMQEYAKTNDGEWDYTHRLYAYIGSDLIFVPGGAGWYPRTTPIFNYIPERNWIYPAREPNNKAITLQVEGDFPIVADQNMLYGYPGLVVSVLDGVEYYHLQQHQASIGELHQRIKDKLFFLQMLVPVPKIQVFEVPQNLLLGDLMIENGFGRIMLSENLLLAMGTKSEGIEYDLDRSIFSGWFNLSNVGFDYHSPDIPGFMMSHLPGRSLGNPATAVALYAFCDYVFHVENDLLVETKEVFLENQGRGMAPTYAEQRDVFVKYYHTLGLGATKEVLQRLFTIEQGRRLTEDDLIEQTTRGFEP